MITAMLLLAFTLAPPDRVPLPRDLVVGADATAAEQAAAESLRDGLHSLTGEAFAVRNDAPSGAAIFVGPSASLNARHSGIDVASLGAEGFVLETAGADWIVAGGRPRGTAYAVQSLLERCGRRVLSSKVVAMPGAKIAAELAPLHVREVPRLEYREPFFTDAFDRAFALANRANGDNHHLTDADGGKVSYAHFVHTFYEIVPPDRYFGEHPDYFSLVKGARTHENAQLCLTNPDVLRITIDTVKKWMRESSRATIFSVSQNDCHNPCECDACRAIDDAEGSHAGSLLAFVNRVAEAIETEFPDKVIDTLAYQYTRKPPKTIRPRKNVIVRLCSIECCFSHPIETCPKNASFRDDLVGWSKLTDRLYVWDYVTNFAHYLQPLPNVHVLVPNIRFFADHGVRGIFEEGNYSRGGGGEMNELKAYVLARGLWDPSIDARRTRDEFLDGWFGKAAPPIAKWLDRLEEVTRTDDLHATIYDPPSAKYLRDEVLAFGESCFAEAERLAGDEVVRARVRTAGLAIRWVRLQRSAPDARAKLLTSFAADARAAGINEIGEGRSLDDYLKSLGQ
ncbi:MAG: DUF4838 domain-containing protein [Planctomycetes bacterium]|nr:DUF4838 domain-containing protein [Planctomycetota bacterium]MBI3848506.1 DUF4838 domain-containing protein [Planctomycetota bacterium]